MIDDDYNDYISGVAPFNSSVNAQLTNSSGADRDQDGITDRWKIDNSLDPKNPNDANYDLDGDGLPNIDEYKWGTDPQYWDTDRDGYGDMEEIKYGSDPNNPASYPDMNGSNYNDEDNFDYDGLTNKDEYASGTNPNKGDTDNDGFSDRIEIEEGSDPNDANDTSKSINGQESSGTPISIADLPGFTIVYSILIFSLIMIIRRKGYKL